MPGRLSMVKRRINSQGANDMAPMDGQRAVGQRLQASRLFGHAVADVRWSATPAI